MLTDGRSGGAQYWSTYNPVLQYDTFDCVQQYSTSYEFYSAGTFTWHAACFQDGAAWNRENDNNIPIRKFETSAKQNGDRHMLRWETNKHLPHSPWE
jgi:hypothetical protein